MPTAKYDPDLPEKSRALAEDPAGYVAVSDLPPLPPAHRQTQQAASILSPLLMLVGVFMLLVLLTTGILRTIDDSPEQASNFPSAANPISCAVIAEQDVNVREGPGFDYARAWILPSGQTRWAAGRTQDNWYQVENGWVLAEDVRLTSQTACAGLQVARSPRIFDDEIMLPESVAALDWRLILDESFATNANQWQDANFGDVEPSEGALSIRSAMQVVAPMSVEQQQPLDEAYYTFRVAWAVSEPTGSLLFTFQQSGAGSYGLEIRQNGTLALWQVDPEGNLLPLNSVENILPVQDEAGFVVGVLNYEEQTRVFINDVLVLTDNNILPAGIYSFSLRGRGSVARINRLDIRVP